MEDKRNTKELNQEVEGYSKELLIEFYESAFLMDSNFTCYLLLEINDPLKSIIKGFKEYNRDFAARVNDFSKLEKSSLNDIVLKLDLSNVNRKHELHKKLMLDFKVHFDSINGVELKILSDNIKVLIYEYFNGKIAECWNEFKRILTAANPVFRNGEVDLKKTFMDNAKNEWNHFFDSKKDADVFLSLIIKHFLKIDYELPDIVIKSRGNKTDFQKGIGKVYSTHFTGNDRSKDIKFANLLNSLACFSNRNLKQILIDIAK
jgi:hypothetical protein